MSWLDEITEPKTPITLTDENGQEHFFRVTPCSRKGSFACFLDLAHLPDYPSGGHHRAVVAMLDAILQCGLVPRVAPDNRPLPSPTGEKRKVGGVMIYANAPLRIEAKKVQTT